MASNNKRVNNETIFKTSKIKFPDHHDYSEADISSLVHEARTSGATGLITTEKDQVKLSGIIPMEAMLLILPVRLVPAEDFNRFLAERLAEVNV